MNHRCRENLPGWPFSEKIPESRGGPATMENGRMDDAAGAAFPALSTVEVEYPAGVAS
jgi:hypothetical protein